MANRKLLLLSVRLFLVKKNTVGAISKHCGSDFKTLWERFKNTMGEK